MKSGYMSTVPSKPRGEAPVRTIGGISTPFGWPQRFERCFPLQNGAAADPLAKP
jgi:hypothetical protein